MKKSKSIFNRTWLKILPPILTVLIASCGRSDAPEIISDESLNLPTVYITETSTSIPPTLTPTSIPPTLTPSPVPPTLTLTPTITQTPPLGSGSTMVSAIDGAVMVYVPDGEFIMGSQWGDELAKSDEKPQHIVYLGSFWIDQTEVTVRQYNLCIEAGQCSTMAFSSADVPFDYYENPMYADYPAVDIPWQGARAYCIWAGRRLPTEAEWEKAARGTEGIIYPWGNITQNGGLGNFCDLNCDLDWKDTSVNDSYMYRSPVGNYPAGASPYGALDMAGNVWEWVADWYGETYYTSTPSSGPQGPGTGSERVVRGGCWGSTLTNLRTAKRFHRQPNMWFGDVGFRCAMDVDG